MQDSGFFERTVLAIDQRAPLLGRAMCVYLINAFRAAVLQRDGLSAERRRVKRLASGPKTALYLSGCRT